MSSEYETKEARQQLGKAGGRVHITANDTGLAGPVVGGSVEHRWVMCPYGENLFAAFQCGQDLREFWLRSAANDNRMSVSQKLRMLRMIVHRAGQALVAVALRQFDRKPGR